MKRLKSNLKAPLMLESSKCDAGDEGVWMKVFEAVKSTPHRQRRVSPLAPHLWQCKALKVCTVNGQSPT